MIGLQRPEPRGYPARRPGWRAAAMADPLDQLSKGEDAGAFRTLYETYAPRVKAYMQRRGADAATAEDLAQETLLTVWRKAALYSSERGSAAAWIFTIARNLRIDRLRQQMPVQSLADDYRETASDAPPPDDALHGAEVRRRIQTVLGELPPDQHEVVVLAYVEGLSQSEIADRLAIPLGTVKSRMRLAYRRLRPAVEDLA